MIFMNEYSIYRPAPSNLTMQSPIMSRMPSLSSSTNVTLISTGIHSNHLLPPSKAAVRPSIITSTGSKNGIANIHSVHLPLLALVLLGRLNDAGSMMVHFNQLPPIMNNVRPLILIQVPVERITILVLHPLTPIPLIQNRLICHIIIK